MAGLLRVKSLLLSCKLQRYEKLSGEEKSFQTSEMSVTNDQFDIMRTAIPFSYHCSRRFFRIATLSCLFIYTCNTPEKMQS